MIEGLQLVIRTPYEVVFDQRVRSARVPTESGQVGLRPRQEPLLLAVEPGLILLSLSEGLRFAASAGGLFEGGRERAVLYTPFAVVSEQEQEVLAALDRALATPDSEIAARRRLGELEERIVEELRHRPPTPRARERHG
jgi:F0F1-type ATP synthase epsilon subunit